MKLKLLLNTWSGSSSFCHLQPQK